MKHGRDIDSSRFKEKLVDETVSFVPKRNGKHAGHHSLQPENEQGLQSIISPSTMKMKATGQTLLLVLVLRLIQGGNKSNPPIRKARLIETCFYPCAYLIVSHTIIQLCSTGTRKALILNKSSQNSIDESNQAFLHDNFDTQQAC